MKSSLGIVALATLVLAACGSGGAAPEVTVTPPTATVTSTRTVTTTATVTASPPAMPTSGTLALGTKASFKLVDVTVFASKRITRQEGVGWAVDAKACSKGTADEPIAITWFPWTLVDSNSGTYEWAHTTWGNDPIPAYPNDEDKRVLAGQCVRGWIVFEVNADTKATEVRYANSAGETAAWKLG